MEKLKCIVHYSNQSCYSPIKILSQTNIQKIKEASEKRQRLGDSNLHHDQVCQIPDLVDPEIHGIHLEPCYKRYVVI